MSGPEPITQLLLAVPLVVVVCRVGGGLLARLGQPPVVGEIAAGIMLGPSLLGHLWPGLQQALFPESVVPYVGALGHLGLLIFMFLMGLELDLPAVRGQTRLAVAVSQTGICVALVLGGLLGWAMYSSYAPDGVALLPFLAFVSVAMSITAFPVLMRILTDRNLQRTRTGRLVTASAAVDDLTAWCLLAVAITLAQSQSLLHAAVTTVGSAVFVVTLLLVVRPLLARWARRPGLRDETVMILLFTGMCLAALAAHRIGIHALFGAFLFGLAAPRGSAAVARAAARLRAFVLPVLLPLFFAHTGLHTDIGLLTGITPWLWAGAVLGVAVAGKWGGTALAARIGGLPWREALSVGALMNCRGLTELVVLSVGLELGVIGPDLFTVLVFMALFTTAVTAPALAGLRGRRPVSPGPRDGGPPGRGSGGPAPHVPTAGAGTAPG